MNKEQTENHSHKRPNVTGSADVQTLIHSINTAYKTSALFFMVVELAPILEEHFKKNEAITPIELETLVAQAAKTMLDG
jgi:hypothetical protein